MRDLSRFVPEKWKSWVVDDCVQELTGCVCVCVCVWETSGCVWSFLMNVSFSGCGCISWEQTWLTDAGLRCLAALPNLVSLSMSYLANVSDKALEAVASRGKLQKLMCRGCLSVTDVGCIRYLHFFKKDVLMCTCLLLLTYCASK
jgi:hypothetical protein